MCAFLLFGLPWALLLLVYRWMSDIHRSLERLEACLEALEICLNPPAKEETHE